MYRIVTCRHAFNCTGGSRVYGGTELLALLLLVVLLYGEIALPRPVEFVSDPGVSILHMS